MSEGSAIRDKVLGRMLQQTMPYALAADEDRCAQRHPVVMPAILRPSCQAGFRVLVTNLSIAGFGCDGVTGMREGTRCWLTMPGFAGLQAEIMWNDGRTVGGAFDVMLNDAVLQTLVARYRSDLPD